MTNLALVLILLLITINYRVELGPFSLTLVEPVIVVFFGFALLLHMQVYKRFALKKDLLISLLLGLLTWIVFVQLLNPDFTHGLSDIRDWLIPALCYFAFFTLIQKDWRHWLLIFLFFATLNAFVGLYQHYTDSFRPFVLDTARFKTLILSEQFAFTSYSVGFFSHPNSFAIYIFLALMISLGWFMEPGHRLIKLVVVGLLALTLFFTYAKTSFMVGILAIVLFFFLQKRGPKRDFWIIAGLLGLLAVLIVVLGFAYLPANLLITFWWRVNLWNIALDIIRNNPMILLRGNGLDLFAQIAPYSQPHNVYLFLVLQYGLASLVPIFLIIWTLVLKGRFAYRMGWFHQEPFLAGLWIWLLSFFGIGLLESTLGGIDMRILFIIGLVSFTGLLRQVNATTAQSPVSEKDPLALNLEPQHA